MFFIKVLSDIHLESLTPFKCKRLVDKIIGNKELILILAGDIGNPYKSTYLSFLENISDKFKKIFLIAGNHEFYNNDIDYTQLKIQQLITDKNIIYLNNTSYDYEGHKFIGSTLWSHVDPIITPININDVYSIKNFDRLKYNNLHFKCVESLNEMIGTSTLPCIVITHHMPLNELIDQKYQGLGYNQWFASDQSDLLKHKNIPLWIYGHTHTCSDRVINNVRFVCNPIGYSGENLTYDLNYTI